ncbi:hypothetical protein EDB80DRAFT_209776 [Ilyonectria destructans]|nr:hypothetical protein EDB80DRAFT_209776 [Ilyonectria destructans]
MSSTSQVHLIPWDPNSSEHVDRLIKQREGCGWDSEKVQPLWQERQRLGRKCIFWITLPIPTDEPDADGKLLLHFDMFPMDKRPLQDTCASIRGAPRAPTHESFYPVGHISLDSENPGTEGFGLDIPSESVYWIKTFYVSQALRGTGIGRAAMDTIEMMAVEKPLSARTLALDTVQKDSAIALAIENTGQSPKMTAHSWYEKRHYELIHTVDDFYAPGLKTVFMKKNIT